MNLGNLKPSYEKAVAIKYKPEQDQVPKVVQYILCLLQQEIKKLALQHGIPIKEDDDLVELLAQVDIDREIPPELYAAVAEVLAWLAE